MYVCMCIYVCVVCVHVHVCRLIIVHHLLFHMSCVYSCTRVPQDWIARFVDAKNKDGRTATALARSQGFLTIAAKIERAKQQAAAPPAQATDAVSICGWVYFRALL